jgi:hypothetical protein
MIVLFRIVAKKAILQDLNDIKSAVERAAAGVSAPAAQLKR